MVHYESINPQNASLEERELYFRRANFKDEAPNVLLQTCNRIEVYKGEGEVPDEVIRHLFRVTSGLESALPGERAIQGQVKEAYRQACESHKLPVSMHKLFEAALAVGKRVRIETEISQGAVSHSLAALEIMKEEEVDFAHSLISIIGVNKLTEDTIKFLKNKGSQAIFLANRSVEKARVLAQATDCEVCDLRDKHKFIAFSDILITATSAPHLIIRPEDIDPQKKLLIIDLAFPRDVDERIRSFPNVSLYNLQDIEGHIRRNITLRKHEMVKAAQIIEEEIQNLQAAFQKRKERIFLQPL